MPVSFLKERGAIPEGPRKEKNIEREIADLSG